MTNSAPKPNLQQRALSAPPSSNEHVGDLKTAIETLNLARRDSIDPHGTSCQLSAGEATALWNYIDDLKVRLSMPPTPETRRAHETREEPAVERLQKELRSVAAGGADSMRVNLRDLQALLDVAKTYRRALKTAAEPVAGCEGRKMPTRVWENGTLVCDVRVQQEGESSEDFAARLQFSALYAETTYRDAWRVATTLAHNLCVQESDRINAEDGPPEAMHALGEAARRIRGWLEPTDEQLLEMLREGGVRPVETKTARDCAACMYTSEVQHSDPTRIAAEEFREGALPSIVPDGVSEQAEALPGQ